MPSSSTKAKPPRPVAEPVAGENGTAPYVGLPRRSWEELYARAKAQGAPLAADPERLRGDFWPEEEGADDFITAVRGWRQEGAA